MSKALGKNILDSEKKRPKSEAFSETEEEFACALRGNGSPVDL